MIAATCDLESARHQHPVLFVGSGDLEEVRGCT